MMVSFGILGVNLPEVVFQLPQVMDQQFAKYLIPVLVTLGPPPKMSLLPSGRISQPGFKFSFQQLLDHALLESQRL